MGGGGVQMETDKDGKAEEVRSVKEGFKKFKDYMGR
jgi:hypothetical protein